MVNEIDPLRFTEERQASHNKDSAFEFGLAMNNVDGYRCLEAFGDDLSLEDATLIETDDLLMTA